MIGRLAAAKNSAMSRLSGAEPETSTRSRPPRRSCSLLKTSFSATANLALRAPPTGLPACSSATFCLPTPTAQPKIFALAPPAPSAVVTVLL